MNIKAVLIFSGIASLLALGDRYEISYFYAYLMNSYSIHSLVTFSYIFTVFYLGYTATQIPGGILAAKYGSSKIMALGLFSWSIFLMIMFLTHSFEIALLSGFLMGLTQGPIYPSMMQLLRDNYKDSDYPSATSVTTFFGDISPAFIFLISSIPLSFLSVPRTSAAILTAIGFISGIYLLTVKKKSDTSLPSGKFYKLIRDGRYWILGISFLSYDAFFYILLSWYPVIEKIRIGSSYGGTVSYIPWIIMGFAALFFGRIMGKFNKDLLISMISYSLLIIGVFLMLSSSSLMIFLLMVTVTLSILNPILIGFWRLSTRINGSENSSLAGGWMNFWGNLGGLISPFLTAFSIEKFGLIGIAVLMFIFIIMGMVSRFVLGEVTYEENRSI